MDEETRKELEFLRYFYDAVGPYLGPADSDIYAAIKQRYGGELPENMKTNDE